MDHERTDQKRLEKRKPALVWLVALGAVAIATAIRFLLHPLLGNELPFLVFVAAALAAAWFGGALPGVVALLLGVAAAEILFVPHHASVIEAPSLAIRLVRYMVTTGLGIIFIEVLHRQRVRSESAADQAQREMMRCREVEQRLREAHEQILTHSKDLEKRVAERTAHLQTTIRSLEGILYHLAHDLRGPLRAMNGFAEMLSREHSQELSETGRDHVRRIANAAARMDTLIRDLLAYGRLGHVSMPLEPTDLRAVVEAVLSRMRQRIERSGAMVRSGQLHFVMGNAEVLEHVIHELVENGIHFSRETAPPQITISSAVRNGMVRVSVEDNGPGIPVQHHDRVFRIFEQLDPAGPKTGIGLAIARQAIERMQGRIQVNSEPGKGSCFWFELPAAPEPPPRASAGQA